MGGVIAGMVAMGFIADKFGRRAGSIITSAVMLMGCIALACSYGLTASSQFTMFTIALCLYEYVTLVLLLCNRLCLRWASYSTIAACVQALRQ